MILSKIYVQLWELADAIINRKSSYVVERNQQQDPGVVLITSVRVMILPARMSIKFTMFLFTDNLNLQELVLMALADLQGRYLMALPFVTEIYRRMI
ncbi:hypothetical protein SLA2020_070860 [Shorea laevis]